jgi:ABC-type nitrate/sulfonate/bicarbonate transport system substrate-binding protein
MTSHRLDMTILKCWRCYWQPAVLLMSLGLCVPRDLTAADKLVFGWSAIAGSQAVPWITKEAGLFDKHGLDTTLIYLDGGSRAIQVLLSGDVPIFFSHCPVQTLAAERWDQVNSPFHLLDKFPAACWVKDSSSVNSELLLI